MRRFFEFFGICLIRCALWFRYRITVKGKEFLDPKYLKKPGGVLFLPNHVAIFVDPLLVWATTWSKYAIRPMVTEYMYYAPFLHPLFRYLDALPVPDLDNSSNSLKRKRITKALSTIVKRIKEGENFLIYPAGRTKSTSKEKVRGASGVHTILEQAPETNVVLVRIKGLWGSSFSRAITGKAPPIGPTLWHGIKCAFKNLLFFLPRREISIEFVPAPDDFPYEGSRMEMNQWLEDWYNQPDGLTEQVGSQPGESLIFVSYSMWKDEFIKVEPKKALQEIKIDLDKVPSDVHEKVIHKIAELTEMDPDSIRLEMSLTQDLGLDSLDLSELTFFLEDQFDVAGVPALQLTSVAKVIGIAGKVVVCKKEEEDTETDHSKWNQPIPRFRAQIAHGESIVEVFLHNCERMGNQMACADIRTGLLTYQQLKMRAILLADCIRKYPGEYIGIMLPASTAAYLTILAVLLAGKIPVMVNWTIGPRHLESINKLTNFQVCLTSWAFLDRLGNVDLDFIDEKLVMLETVRREMTLWEKIRALLLSKRSAESIMKRFKVDTLSKDDRAVVLFTSGSESMPKGVPLTHENILSNQRSAFDAIAIYSDDVMYGVLPPFHSFGFTVSGLLGLLAGVRVAYHPDPTDGPRMVKGFERWGITIMCGAPTFLKNLLRSARPDQLKKMRICVSGAEKAPPELFAMLAEAEKEQCLVEGYGVTECSPMITANRIGKPQNGVGWPLPGIEVSIVHPDTHALKSQGEEGLILVYGPNVFSGYLNPGLSSPFITIEGKQWYNTGDLGFLDEEGRLTISGRLKRFIKVGGEMISLTAIEDAFLNEAIRKGWQQEDGSPVVAICAKEIPGDKPKIYLFTQQGIDIDKANKILRSAGFSNLIKVTNVIHMEVIPIMGTGKINYRELDELCPNA